MEANRRYTTMVFPQGFKGGKLSLHIVLIPRNQDPTQPFQALLVSPTAQATAFADLVPEFEIGVVRGLDEWPLSNATAPSRIPVKKSITVDEATRKKALLTALGSQFAAQLTLTNTTDNSGSIIAEDISVKKYLPLSYRNAFNFTTPRHKNAVTDDSYECALRKVTPKIPKPNVDNISWGQLYANILRQPLLAYACGVIYNAEISVSDDPALFAKGCYIYANIINPDYVTVQAKYLEDATGPFIKRYAARIPKLKVGSDRPVFAPLLFPVLYRKITDAVDPEPLGDWDNIFAEVNEYNDGFGKIVHAAQPVSLNLLKEEQDGAHPVHDAGIRLAWDDEQILIWYIRQLAANPLDPSNRVDAPLGVFGYAIDVKKSEDIDWESLNLVETDDAKSGLYKINGTETGITGGHQIELPYQVFPSQQEPGAAYWLPVYFTNWIGKSLVLKDEQAIAINQNDKALDDKDKTTPKKVTVENAFNEVAVKAKLLYGNNYDFRVRLKDISGGSPDVTESAPAAGTASVPFKRFIAPAACRILNRPVDLAYGKIEFYNETGTTYNGTPDIQIKRPLLNYPAVVFTGKYQASGEDPVQLILDSMKKQGEVNPPDPVNPLKPVNTLTPAIADPDVTKIAIKVEVETLRMDNSLSGSGRENYITLYDTIRNFPVGYDDTLDLSIKFYDEDVLNFDDKLNPFDVVKNKELNKLIAATSGDIPLPTARRVRVTFRAACDGDSSYFGFINDGNHDLDSRYGKTTQVWFYKESADETVLLKSIPPVSPVQAIYLQPDPINIYNGNIASKILFREGANNQPDMVQRLAQQLGVEAKGLTLVGKKGERVVFGCSNKIRHHLAPDNSSITFSSKADLSNHWLGGLVYNINRDWTWDALKDTSFNVCRTKRFQKDPASDTETLDQLGTIEVKHTASFQALQPDDFGKINRQFTTIIFIDAIEPKTGLTQAISGQLRFPDGIHVEYTLTPFFKPNHGTIVSVDFAVNPLDLPTTIIPAQVPKIVSAGLAFSPYIKNDKYSATEARQRYLWVELAEPVQDPNDTVFCRVLAYAPDQMISNNEPGLQIVPEEPLLPIDPEYIRVITSLQADDMAGLNAMQAMEKANGDDNVHYLLSLPPGLNPESSELFGFFTYEFRIGHGHWSDDKHTSVWSTAHGRFGRPLRITGMQHPAPTLLCTVNRNDAYLYASAPYAKAVWQGRNVTSNPPRSNLYCLLYAQVMQADGLQHRNILLDDKLMTWQERFIWKGTTGTPTKVMDPQKLTGEKLAIFKDSQRTGMAYWRSQEIANLLIAYGLPEDSPLSVLVVETFGNITKRSEQVEVTNHYYKNGISDLVSYPIFYDKIYTNNSDSANSPQQVEAFMNLADENRPLSNNLGNYRILRTSPLTEVPFVCCPTC